MIKTMISHGDFSTRAEKVGFHIENHLGGPMKVLGSKIRGRGNGQDKVRGIQNCSLSCAKMFLPMQRATVNILVIFCS